ncbi:MAG: ATP-grasp domain-containing protein [Micrococcales bacterium]|nr:ATP-grasp domain-containing protein [Micrococcales bacterium]
MPDADPSLHRAADLGQRPVRRALIVDPLSTGRELAPEFRRRGWQTTAAVSIPWIADAINREDFDEVLIDEPGSDLRGRVRALAPDAIVPGAEFGVLLAEELAAQQGLPVNIPLPDDPRRDKSAMLHRLRERGVRAMAGELVRTPEELERWLTAWGRYPVVVKPARSAGSDSVSICHDAPSAHAAFDAVAGQRNSLGVINDGALVEEYLSGQQYYTNSVSIDGLHRVHEVWRVDFTVADGRPLYDREVLLGSDDRHFQPLIDYTDEVLTALGVTDGAAHTEIRMQGEEPVLIESGARLAGASDMPAHRAATGTNPVELLVDRYADPAAFRARLHEPPLRRRHVSAVALQCPRPSTATVAGLDALHALPTAFGGPALELRAGARLRPTVDLYSVPGILYLVGADAASVDRDYAAVRRIEAEQLYRPMTESEQRRWALARRARWIRVRVVALPSWTARRVRSRIADRPSPT